MTCIGTAYEVILTVVIVLCIVALILALFFGMAMTVKKEHRQRREKLLQNGERIDDSEYCARLPFLQSEPEREFALRMRTVFAKIPDLPRECITPEMQVDDLFNASDSTLYDGMDLAVLVMEIEDEFAIEIPESDNGTGIRMNFVDDTVASLTQSLIQYARQHWPTLL